MKNKIGLIGLVIMLFVSIELRAQTYNKSYSTNSGNYFNSRSGFQTADQNYVLFGSMMMGGNFLTKMNAQGDTIWNKAYQGTGNTFANVCETTDGSLVAVTPNWTSVHYTKVSSTGNLSWSNSLIINSLNGITSAVGSNIGNDVILFAGSQSDTLLFARVGSAGNVIWTSRPVLGNILAGITNKKIYIDGVTKSASGTYYVLGRSEGDFGEPVNILIMEIDNNGTILYVKGINNTASNFTQFYGNTIIEATNGDLLISGTAYIGGVQGTGIIRTNSAGSLVWAKHISDNANKVHLTELNSGEIVVSSGNSNLPADGIDKNTLIKIDANGNFIWARTFGSQYGNLSIFVCHDNLDVIHVGAETSGYSSQSSLLVYGVTSNGMATGCFDVLTSVPFSNWTPVITSTTFTMGISNYSTGVNSITVGSNVSTMQNRGLTTNGIVNSPLCFGEDGNVSYTVSQGTTPYNFNWSNGTNSQNLVNAGANTYQVRVSDAEGCVALDTFDIIEPTALTGSLIPTDVTCFGSQDGSINLSTFGGTPGYTYQWATQATTEDISGLSGGFYQVIISDANGCEKIVGISIAEPQQLFAAITGSQNVSCYGACDGSLSGLGSGGTSPYVLGWNDVNNTIGSSVSNLCPGNYLFTVTDNNGCVSYSNGTITEPLPISSTTASAGSECGVANGAASIDVIGGTMPYTYSWTSGDMSDTAISLNPGVYDVAVTDNNGCMINESVMVNTVTNPVEICVVTVDSTDNNNMIIWEKPVSQNIQGFYIYRNIAGAYSQIGYQPYDSISQFVDNSFGVDPAVTSYRYEISVLDSCGNESELSNFHETIHLTSNLGLNDEVNLIWDDYEGFSFTQYNILRDSSGNGSWEQIATVGSSSFTYTDLSPPQTSSLRYLVEVVLPATCSATKAQDHNTTRSNRASIAEPNANSIEELILSQAKVYPNPSNGLFTVNVKSDNWSYSIFDMSGKLISDATVLENNTNIDIQELETGIYLMKINLGDNAIYKKIVKE